MRSAPKLCTFSLSKFEHQSLSLADEAVGTISGTHAINVLRASWIVLSTAATTIADQRYLEERIASLSRKFGPNLPRVGVPTHAPMLQSEARQVEQVGQEFLFVDDRIESDHITTHARKWEAIDPIGNG